MIRRAITAWPTLIKVSFAEAVAYRAEFLVWILTTTMPFIMLALMSSVVAEGPIEGYDQQSITAYYLATFRVRLLTGAWVVWEMTMEIRSGAMGLRLLRPIHPFVVYATSNLAALPIRGLIALPLVAALLVFASDGITSDPRFLACAALAIAGAWLLNFLVMACIGCLAFRVESATSIFEVWLGIWVVMSGYLLPLDLFPPWVQVVSRWLPFRLMLDLPVRLELGRLDGAQALEGLATQWAWILGVGTLAMFLWRSGIRRYQAFGG